MKELEKNRVYHMSEIQRLQTAATSLLQTGEEACQAWDSAFISLCGLESHLPAHIRSALLSQSLETIIYPMTKDEYQTLNLRIAHTLGKLTDNLPLCDADAARALETNTTLLETTNQKIQQLKDYLKPDILEKTYTDYTGALTRFREMWEQNTLTLEEKLQQAQTLLKGLPAYTHYYGDPVNIQTGNFTFTCQDLTLKKHPSLTLTRTYNAMDKTKGSLGKGWIHNWETRLHIRENTLLFIHPDGREEPFLQQTETTWKNSTNTTTTIQKTKTGYYCLNRETDLLIFRPDGKPIHLLPTAPAQPTITLTYREEQPTQIKADTGETLTLTYDKEGSLIGAKDHTGRTLTYTYTGKKLTAVTDPLGQTTRYTYAKNGRIQTITDKRNQPILQNTYDPYRRITTQTFPDGSAITFTYKDHQNQTLAAPTQGSPITWSHDCRLRNIQTACSDGKKHYTYDQNNNCTTYIHKQNQTTTCAYDQNGRLITLTDPEGQTTAITYDKEGRPKTLTTPGQKTTAYTYDTGGNLTKITTPLGETITITTTPEQNTKTVHLPDKRTLTITYDNKRNISHIAYPDGTAAGYTYDPLNRITTITDAAGNKTTCEYDPLDRITKITRPDGAYRTYTYNPMGEATAIRDFDGCTSYWEYNQINKPKTHTDKAGQTTHMTYDKKWNLTTLTAPLGRTTTWRYSPEGTLTETEDPAGNKIRCTYNHKNQLTQILQLTKEQAALPTQNPEALKREPATLPKTTFQRNKTGQIQNITNALGQTTAYTYDTKGRVQTKTDPQGQTTAYTYYPDDSLKTAAYPDTTTLTLTYHPTGHLQTITDQTGQTTIKRDTKGRMTHVTDHKGRTLRYTWNPDGTKQQIQYPDGTRIHYTYDTQKRPTAIKSGAFSLHYTYDTNNRITKIQRGNNTTSHYTYNNLGQPTAITHKKGEELLEQLTYTYDPAGNLATALRTTDNPAYNYSHAYTYDQTNRLTQVWDTDPDTDHTPDTDHSPDTDHTPDIDHTPDTDHHRATGKLLRQYQYDGCGNRIQTTRYLPQSNTYQTEQTTYNPLNQPIQTTILPEQTCRQYRYNPNGGLKQVLENGKETTAYTYDSAGRLTHTYKDGKLLSQKQYDGLGTLLTTKTPTPHSPEHTTDSPQPHSPGHTTDSPLPDSPGHTTTDYLIDYTDPYRRILMEQGEHQRTYLWQDNNLLGIPTEQAYLLTDRQNTPIRLLDKDGNTKNTYSHDEYGILQKQEETIPLPFGYTGYLKEPEDNLYFAGTRVYNSEQGTFLTKDHYTYLDIKNPNSANLYAYTQGNPLRYLDYSGHQCIEEKDYLQRTLEMLLLGNFSEEFTGLGLTIQIILGLVGVDLIFDIRDLIADLSVNFEPTAPEWWSQIGLGIVAFLPAVGLLKFSDELSTASKGGWKALIKNTDEIAAGAKPAVRNAAEIIQAGKRNSEDLAKQIRKLTKETGEQAEEILDDLRKAEKAADGLDVVEEAIEGGLETLSTPSSKALRQNLIEAGVEVPNYPNAAHHIVAGNAPKAAEARAILQKYGVDINDAANGTFLPTAKDIAEAAYHPGLHTDSYYRKITELLSSAKSKDDVLDILDDISEQLQNDTFK